VIQTVKLTHKLLNFGASVPSLARYEPQSIVPLAVTGLVLQPCGTVSQQIKMEERFYWLTTRFSPDKPPSGEECTNSNKAILVTDRGGLEGCEMLKIRHCLNSRLVDGGKVVGPVHWPSSTPQKHYFSPSGTCFC
jgi:hypothetical protein